MTTGDARIALDPDDMRKGLGRLVLALLELLRQLMERQALRRAEHGSLADAELERLGVALMRLAEEMDWLRQQFGLAEDDLALDLGPLGRLF